MSSANNKYEIILQMLDAMRQYIDNEMRIQLHQSLDQIENEVIKLQQEKKENE